MPHQHQPPGLGEAILRELGVFGQSVGRQLQANQQFNVESQQRNLIDRLSFEAREQQRGALLGQGQERLDISGQRLGIAESAEERAGQLFDIQHPVGPQQPQFKTVGALEASLAQQALEAGGEQGFLDFKARSAAAGRAPTVPTGITPAKRDEATQEVFEQKRQEVLERAGAVDLQGLRELSAEGLAQEESGGFLGFGATPGPDSTAFNALQQFREIGTPEHAAAFERGDSLRAFRPALFPGQPQQQGPTLDTLTSRGVEPGVSQPADNLVRAQSRILKAVGGPVTSERAPAPSRRQLIEQFGNLTGGISADFQPAVEPALAGESPVTEAEDQKGRELYDDWDSLSPADKVHIVELGFPTE